MSNHYFQLPRNYDRQFDAPWDQPKSYTIQDDSHRPVLAIYGHGNFHFGACEHCGVTLTNAVLGKLKCTSATTIRSSDMADWTQEEREAAHEQLDRNATMTDLQCAVNALRDALEGLIKAKESVTLGKEKKLYEKFWPMAYIALAKTKPAEES